METPTGAEELRALVRAREAEIFRIETCLANERRAALAIRKDLDQITAAYEELLLKQRQSTWLARFRRLVGR